MVRINILISAILMLILIACGANEENKSNLSSNDEVSSYKSADQVTSEQAITADSTLITQYEQSLTNGNKAEEKLAQQILDNIKIYNGESIRDDFLTIGNIDGVNPQDTIRTVLEVINDTVFIHSKWYRNNELLWELSLTDPYMYINDDNPLFEYQNSPIWTRLTIAKDYTIPVLSKKSKYDYIGTKWVIYSGINDFKNSNHEVDSASYREYILNFKGQLLEYGEPEIRKLVIWHEPTKMFVSYYSP